MEVEDNPRNQLGYVLWQLQHRIKLTQERELAELRLNLPQFATLLHLSREPGLSTAALARLLMLTPQGVSPLISRLEAAGYLTRGTPSGGRSQPLSLTPTGQQALTDAWRVVEATERRAFAPLTADEYARMHQLASRCLERVEESEPEPPAPASAGDGPRTDSGVARRR